MSRRRDAAVDDGDGAILAAPGELGGGVAGLADGLGDGAAPPRADDAHVAVADGQPLLDDHPDHVARGEAGGIADHVPEVAQVAAARW